MSPWFLVVVTLASPPQHIQMPSQTACVLQMSAQFYREALAKGRMREYTLCHNLITDEKIYPDQVHYELIAHKRNAKPSPK